MNATEKITAAIARLDAQRTGSEVQGEWLIERVNECTCAGADQYGHEAHEHGCGTLPLTNDPLTVTLHRTIDAQMAILRSSLDWFIKAEAEWPQQIWEKHPDLRNAIDKVLRQELSLADAILGVTS